MSKIEERVALLEQRLLMKIDDEITPNLNQINGHLKQLNGQVIKLAKRQAITENTCNIRQTIIDDMKNEIYSGRLTWSKVLALLAGIPTIITLLKYIHIF